jgi:hypothetical protein
MNRPHRRFFAFLVILCASILLTSTLTSSALAEPSAADRATARALAREGFEALKAKDFATAEDRFRRADELVHAPTLVVDHARSLVGLGRLVEAHERYSLVLREGVSPNAAWPWKRAYADAQREIEGIKERLAWLTIKVSGPDAPEVSFDDKPIPSAAIGVRRATDPGEHTIVASGPGYHSKTETMALAEGDEQSLEIELEAMPEAEVAEQPAPAPAAATAPPPRAESTKDNTLAYIALGIGGAGFIAYGIAGTKFMQERSNLQKACVNNSCPDTSDNRDSVDQYGKWGWIAGAGALVGVAGAGAGLYLLLSDSAPAVGTDTAKVSPYATGDSVGIIGQF